MEEEEEAREGGARRAYVSNHGATFVSTVHMARRQGSWRRASIAQCRCFRCLFLPDFPRAMGDLTWQCMAPRAVALCYIPTASRVMAPSFGFTAGIISAMVYVKFF
jgi:hypothetical protein